MKRKLSYKDFYELIERFQVLPDKLGKSIMGNLFEENWKKVFGSSYAKKIKRVVYIWRTVKEISRLKGKSNIVYIGQTQSTLYNRHYRYANVEANGESNVLKYSYIIKEYGPISIYYEDCSVFGESPKEAEDQLLWWYFENHLEYPPVNYTKAKKYNSFITIG